MIKCPECGRSISSTAKTCPSCRGNLAILKKLELKKQSAALVIILIAAAGIASLFVLLSPGLLMNWMSGRFDNDSNGFFLASAQDWITWTVSLSVWVFLGLLSFMFKKWVNKKKETNSPNLLQTVPSPVTEAVKFHIEVDDQDIGEMELEAIKKLVAEGKVKRSTLVWRDGMANWQVAEAQVELRWLFQGQPPPLQPWKKTL